MRQASLEQRASGDALEQAVLAVAYGELGRVYRSRLQCRSGFARLRAWLRHQVAGLAAQRDPLGFGLEVLGGPLGLPAVVWESYRDGDEAASPVRTGGVAHQVCSGLESALSSPSSRQTFVALLPGYLGTLGELVRTAKLLSA